MRLLVLTDWSYPCDLTMLKEIFSKRLKERGHDIVWVMRPDDEEAEDVVEHVWNGNQVYVLPSGGYSPAKTALRFASGRMSRHPVLESIPEISEFDAVHVRNDLSMGLVANYLSKTDRLPYAHQISHFKAESMTHLAKTGESQSRLTDYVVGRLGRLLRRFVVQRADVTLPISDTMKQELREQGYPEPLETFPTGADTSVEPSDIDATGFPEEYGIPDGPVVLYMGTMSPMRNLEFLFKVLENLDSPTTPALLMVGGRDADNREHLQRVADERGHSDNVYFTGWLESYRDVQRAVLTADVGVSPIPPTPILRTNAPLKVLEYLALETPVVASETPDHRTVVGDSGGGIVTEYDATAFAAGVDRLLSDPEGRKEMGKAGRRYIEQERSFDVLTDRLLEIYDRHLLNERT